MSSKERRKERKAKKERLQAKKQARLSERQPRRGDLGRAQAEESLTAMVTAGRARIALTSLDGLGQLMAVMWQPEGVQVHVCDMDDQAGMLAMAAAAKLQQVDADEWHAFINGHMQASIGTGGRETQISLVEWKPGERPPPSTTSLG
jgi:hypothetical protein